MCFYTPLADHLVTNSVVLSQSPDLAATMRSCTTLGTLCAGVTRHSKAVELWLAIRAPATVVPSPGSDAYVPTGACSRPSMPPPPSPPLPPPPLVLKEAIAPGDCALGGKIVLFKKLKNGDGQSPSTAKPAGKPVLDDYDYEGKASFETEESDEIEALKLDPDAYDPDNPYGLGRAGVAAEHGAWTVDVVLQRWRPHMMLAVAIRGAHLVVTHTRNALRLQKGDPQRVPLSFRERLAAAALDVGYKTAPAAQDQTMVTRWGRLRGVEMELVDDSDRESDLSGLTNTTVRIHGRGAIDDVIAVVCWERQPAPPPPAAPPFSWLRPQPPPPLAPPLRPEAVFNRRWAWLASAATVMAIVAILLGRRASGPGASRDSSLAERVRTRLSEWVRMLVPGTGRGVTMIASESKGDDEDDAEDVNDGEGDSEDDRDSRYGGGGVRKAAGGKGGCKASASGRKAGVLSRRGQETQCSAGFCAVAEVEC